MMDNRIDHRKWFDTPFGRAKFTGGEIESINITEAGTGYNNLPKVNSDISLEGSPMEKIISDHLSIMDKKKDEFLKQKIIKRGFEHLIEGMEKKRFPKICCVKKRKWSYHFADNDTDEGAFIVAIKDYDFGQDSTVTFPDRQINMNISFEWRDEYFPGEELL